MQNETAKRKADKSNRIAAKSAKLKAKREAKAEAEAFLKAKPKADAKPDAKPEAKPKPKRPPLPTLHHSYGGSSTCDTQRRACFFVTTGRVFANFRERSDSYLHDLRTTYADATFPGAGRDKAVIEIAIYAGLLVQSDNGAVLSFTTRGKLFTDAKRICPLPGSYVTHAGFFEHIKRLENPAS